MTRLGNHELLVRQIHEPCFQVAIVVAETGSGKTTQLPQYCAEEFDGTIVCTQPRALAAIDISKVWVGVVLFALLAQTSDSKLGSA